MAAARRGFAVLPLLPLQKRPLWEAWPERASPDVSSVSTWPRNTTGYGVSCGPSHLVVVDLDSPKPGSALPAEWAEVPGITNGADVLAELAERAGASLAEVYSTLQVETPGRNGHHGVHLYYQAPAGVELHNTAGAIGPLIDTRAIGGYVCGPGTRTEAGLYRVVHMARPAPLPAWILHLLTQRSRQAASQAGSRPVAPSEVRLSGAGVGPEWIAAALRGEADRIRTAPDGEGNHTVSSAGYRVGQLVGAHLVSRDVAEADLMAALDTWTFAEPRDRSRMVRSLQSGLSSGERNPRYPAPREGRRVGTNTMQGDQQTSALGAEAGRTIREAAA